jgi:hypothetical protein
MSVHTDSVFRDAAVELDGDEFRGCQFFNCRLIYRGGSPPKMAHCKFSQSKFEFLDAARHTLDFIRAIYHGMGPGGQEIIELLFWEIRRRPVAVTKAAPLPPHLGQPTP